MKWVNESDENAEGGNKGLNQAVEMWRKAIALGILGVEEAADVREANFANVPFSNQLID